jgi:hypothetical protein
VTLALDPVSAAFAAVRERLQTFFLPKKWDFHIVSDPMGIDEFKAIVRRTPTLALGWRQLNPTDQKVGRRFQGNLGMRLTIVVKHPLDANKRFMGDAAGPGLFPAMSGAIALLNGFTKPELGTFQITACAQAFAEGYSDANMAIATLDIASTIVVGDVTGDFAAAPDFLSMLSTFEPWPDDAVQPVDGPYDVRPA